MRQLFSTIFSWSSFVIRHKFQWTLKKVFITKKVINIYISYILSPWLRNLNTDFTLKNCLSGPVKLNGDLDKCKYSGYSTGSDSVSEFSFTDGSMGKYAIMSPTHILIKIKISSFLVKDQRND